MIAARWHGAGDIRLQSVPVPRAGLGDILVRVERVGLCGSDLEEYLEGPMVISSGPLTLGHEVLGTIVECPGGELAVGSRVIPDVVVGCGMCWWCQRHEEGLCPDLVVRGQQVDGGLAKYMLARAASAVAVPPRSDLDRMAFAEPTSVAIRAVRKAGDLAGASACVLGAGTIGNLICQVLAASGLRSVIAVEPVERRRKLAMELGATATASPSEAIDIVRRASDGRMADVVFECTGQSAVASSALELSRRGGTVVLVGLQRAMISFPLMSLVLHERRIFGSAAHLFDEDVAAAVALIANGRVDPLPLLAAVVPLANVVEEGFEYMRQQRGALKVLVAP